MVYGMFWSIVSLIILINFLDCLLYNVVFKIILFLLLMIILNKFFGSLLILWWGIVFIKSWCLV